jgi:hypothetical protein
MIRADEVAFGEELADALEGRATWTALAPGLEVGVQHERLGEILPEWGGGARLRLKSGGPIVQYLQGRLCRPDWSLAARPEPGTLLVSAELAYRWFPDEQADEQREAFPKLTRTVMKTLHRHTLANHVELDGTPYRRSRIGKHAARLVSDRELTLRDASWPTGGSLRLRQSP